MSSLQSLWFDLHRARRLGIPVDALRALRADLPPVSPSRRRFMAGGAAAAAGLALPGRARASGQQQGSIAIVGGGIAGLTCGLTLFDAGVDATVYEAAERVGGRMFTNRTGYWEAEQISEWAGELIDTGHETIRSLARRYRLRLDNLLNAQPKKSTDVYFINGAYYPKSQADADFADIFDVVVADEASAPFPTTFDAFTPEALLLDNMSVYEWIESRIPGGHSSPLGQVLDIAYAIEYGADTVDQSALNILYLLAFQPSEHELALYGESDEKFHIRGGNQQLPEAIAHELGERVVLGERLVRIAQTAANRYCLTFKHGQATHDETHDYVVLALPFAVLSEIDFSQAGFDPLKEQAIAEQGRGLNGKLQLQFTDRDWLGSGPWPGISNGSSYADTGYQASWEVTRAQPGEPGILVLYSGGSVTAAMKTKKPFATASNRDVERDALRGLRQLEAVYPSLQWNGKATQSLPHLSPFFRASYSYYRVGQYTTFAGYERERQGNVLFCGEHTSIDFQGFMEGAASEGLRAGEELLGLLG